MRGNHGRNAGVHCSGASWCYVHSTDTQGRSQMWYTVLCNGVVSHGAQIRGIWVFANHTCKNKRKINASTIFAHCAAMHVYLHAQRPSRCRWHTHLMFWLWKKPEYSQFEPHAGVKMAQILGSPLYIYGTFSKWDKTWFLITETCMHPYHLSLSGSHKISPFFFT